MKAVLYAVVFGILRLSGLGSARIPADKEAGGREYFPEVVEEPLEASVMWVGYGLNGPPYTDGWPSYGPRTR